MHTTRFTAVFAGGSLETREQNKKTIAARYGAGAVNKQNKHTLQKAE